MTARRAAAPRRAQEPPLFYRVEIAAMIIFGVIAAVVLTCLVTGVLPR
jgi:hypothetical protein